MPAANAVIKRVMPRQNEEVNEIWICDKGRFGYHFAESDRAPDRSRWSARTASWSRPPGKRPSTWSPQMRCTQAGAAWSPWPAAGWPTKTCSTCASWPRRWAARPCCTRSMAGGDLVGAGRPGARARNLGDMGKGTAILVVACDLEEEAPVWWLRVKQAAERGATLIVANPRATKLDRRRRAPPALSLWRGSRACVLGAHCPDRTPGARPATRPQRRGRSPGTAPKTLVVLYGSEGMGLDGQPGAGAGLRRPADRRPTISAGPTTA